MRAKPFRCRADPVRPRRPTLTPTPPLKISRLHSTLPSDLVRGLCVYVLRMISAQTLRVCREGKPVPTFPDHALPRLLVHPSLEHPHIADIGAEHDVEGVARERSHSDHAIKRHIGQHPRRDVPGRAECARLAD